MTGKRHHILPRFLLKGFASKTQKDKVFTWVYRCGVKPLEHSTKDVAVEKYFYGKNTEVSADEKITDLENIQYAPLLEKLRKNNTTGVIQVYEPEITDYVSHLCTRTKNLRESILESTEYLLDEANKYLSDFDNIKRILKRKTAQSVKFKDLNLLLSSDSNTLDIYEQQLKYFFQNSINHIKGELPRIIKENHNKALAENSISEIRADKYRRLQWFLYTFKQPSVILGDCGCLFEIAGTKKFKTLTAKDEKEKNIFLPIAANQVLIGTILGEPKFKIKELNKVMAKYSLEFFVYSKFSRNMANLALLIGRESGIISHLELDRIIIDAWQ